MMRIKNWDKYQHYKNRNPSWIKLHYEIMTSEDWSLLPDDGKLLSIVCMLLASRRDGEVPDNPAYVKRVAYLDKLPDFGPLLACGFLEITETPAKSKIGASKMLASASKCLQTVPNACSEAEIETDTELKIISMSFQNSPTPDQPDPEHIAESPEPARHATTDAQPVTRHPKPRKRATGHPSDSGLFPESAPPEPELETCLREIYVVWNTAAESAKPTPMISALSDRSAEVRKLWKASKLFREHWREIGKAMTANPFNRGGTKECFRANLDYALRVGQKGIVFDKEFERMRSGSGWERKSDEEGF